MLLLAHHQARRASTATAGADALVRTLPVQAASARARAVRARRPAWVAVVRSGRIHGDIGRPADGLVGVGSGLLLSGWLIGRTLPSRGPRLRSVTRIVTAVLLAAAGFAILRTGALPAWAGRSAYVIAAINTAFVPSLYFGMDPSQFYSALGWATPHWRPG